MLEYEKNSLKATEEVRIPFRAMLIYVLQFDVTDYQFDKTDYQFE